MSEQIVVVMEALVSSAVGNTSGDVPYRLWIATGELPVPPDEDDELDYLPLQEESADGNYFANERLLIGGMSYEHFCEVRDAMPLLLIAKLSSSGDCVTALKSLDSTFIGIGHKAVFLETCDH